MRGLVFDHPRETVRNGFHPARLVLRAFPAHLFKVVPTTRESARTVSIPNRTALRQVAIVTETFILKVLLSIAPLLLFPSLAAAQQSASEASMMGMTQGVSMDMSGMNMHPETFIQEIVGHTSSGTSAEPDSTPIPMLMTRRGPWTLMLHGNVFILDQQQTGPRGADKFFSVNWFMGMAQRGAGPGTFTLRAMLSLDPATITGRRYPLLFQQGETAFGKPIVDGQHPHDFFMELAALYDLRLGERGLLSFYVAPVGDPAMGPIAYPHRASASEDPLAALGHHQEDSTHIASDVLTVGATYGFLRLEASGFHGREPDEFRWNIDHGAIDSWSLRLTAQPGKNWSAQYSYGRLKSPEALYPMESQERMTASVMYNRPLNHGNWSSIVVWGHTRSLQDDSIYNSYLVESTLHFLRRNNVWTRIENVDRSNELLLGEVTLPPNFHEEPIGRVKAYSFGYSREIPFFPHIASSLGAQITTYGVPAALEPTYGAHPAGVSVYLRFRPTSENNR